MAARYRVIKQIGSGGMGRVYLARDNLLERDVALKELRVPDHLTTEERAEMRDRFQLEARAAARLTHPHIVTVHDIITSGERYFIVMEYLNGKTLGDILEEKVLAQDEVISIAPMICDALGYAHAKGVIHRDIKPDNIFALENGNIKVTDFGIAKLHMVQGVTQTGMITGTPNYIAPEVVRDRPYDHRVDVFALGVTFYELMAGSPPFDGETDYAVIYKVASEDPLPLSSIVTDLNPKLDGIITRMLQKEPSQRYSDMKELKEDIMSIRQDLGLIVEEEIAQEAAFDKMKALEAELESLQDDNINRPQDEGEKLQEYHFHADQQWRERIAQVYKRKEEERSRIDSRLFPASDERMGNKSSDSPSYSIAMEEARALMGGRSATPPPVRGSSTPSPIYQQMYQTPATARPSPKLDVISNPRILTWSIANILLYVAIIVSVEMPWLQPTRLTAGTKFGTSFPEGIALLVIVGLALILNTILLTGWKKPLTWTPYMTSLTILAFITVAIFLVLRPMASVGIDYSTKKGFEGLIDLTGWGAWMAFASSFVAIFTNRNVRRAAGSKY